MHALLDAAQIFVLTEAISSFGAKFKKTVLSLRVLINDLLKMSKIQSLQGPRYI